MLTRKYNRPYSDDWVDLGGGICYSEKLHRWWDGKTIYDELSANHNGITGMGASLKKMITNLSLLEEREEDASV